METRRTLQIPLYQPVFRAQPAPTLEQPSGVANPAARSAHENNSELRNYTALSAHILSAARRANVLPATYGYASGLRSDGSTSDSSSWTHYGDSGNTASSRTSLEPPTDSDGSFEDDDSDGETDSDGLWPEGEFVVDDNEEIENASDDGLSEDEEPPETDEALMLSLKRYNKAIGFKYADDLETWFREDYSTNMPLLYVLQGLHCRQESYAAVIIACQKVIEEVRAGNDPQKAKETIRTLVLDDLDQWWEKDPEAHLELGHAKVALVGQLVRVGIFDGSVVSALVDRYTGETYRADILDVFKTLFEYAGIDICAPEYEEQTQKAVERLREVRDMLHNEWRTDAEIDRTVSSEQRSVANIAMRLITSQGTRLRRERLHRVWLVQDLLERGYSVRGTVRAESKATHVRNLFKTHGDKLEIVEVPDITKPGAFDAAVQGVDAIAHTASPFHLNADDPNDVIEPAVKGTVGILESALKHAGPQLRRIAVLSSSVSIEVRAKGRAAGQTAKYFASKSLAEKTAWEFAEKHKSEISWDLVALNPPLVFGPILHEVSSPAALNSSVALFYGAILSQKKMPEEVAKMQNSWVDVREVALGHVRALEIPAAGGQRFILSAGTFIWQDWLDAANELKFPGLTVPTGTPGAGKDFEYNSWYSSAKARTVLGIEFRDKKSTAKDSIENLKAQWVDQIHPDGTVHAHQSYSQVGFTSDYEHSVMEDLPDVNVEDVGQDYYRTP
ncbi:hypothetical protein DFH11DRAFT_1880257 [Phellopilus nigrolimitatus]|nr:hypothetical protein DFH11DRAFT_1880257 [Phellopilus nigrolimitatus]